VASDNTEFPQLEDDACGWDAAGTPKRYMASLVETPAVHGALATWGRKRHITEGLRHFIKDESGWDATGMPKTLYDRAKVHSLSLK
jgi:hypothetical protein